jgi:hypothetical protein
LDLSSDSLSSALAASTRLPLIAAITTGARLGSQAGLPHQDMSDARSHRDRCTACRTLAEEEHQGSGWANANGQHSAFSALAQATKGSAKTGDIRHIDGHAKKGGETDL